MEIISLVLSIISIVISLILGIREINKDKKTIKIFLVYYLFESIAQLKIVNTGHRPLTIAGITAMFPDRGELVPANAIESDIFPKKLEDGEQIFVDLGALGSKLFSEESKCGIAVYDVEGKVYSNIEEMFFNEKFGVYGPPPRKWKRRVN